MQRFIKLWSHSFGDTKVMTRKPFNDRKFLIAYNEIYPFTNAYIGNDVPILECYAQCRADRVVITAHWHIYLPHIPGAHQSKQKSQFFHSVFHCFLRGLHIYTN
jgi:hypothetical protein